MELVARVYVKVCLDGSGTCGEQDGHTNKLLCEVVAAREVARVGCLVVYHLLGYGLHLFISHRNGLDSDTDSAVTIVDTNTFIRVCIITLWQCDQHILYHAVYKVGEFRFTALVSDQVAVFVLQIQRIQGECHGLIDRCQRLSNGQLVSWGRNFNVVFVHDGLIHLPILILIRRLFR